MGVIMFLFLTFSLLVTLLIQSAADDYTITIHAEFLAQGGKKHFEAEHWNGHGGIDNETEITKNKAIGTKSARWVNTDLNGDRYRKITENPHRKGYPDPNYFRNHEFESNLARRFLQNLEVYGYNLGVVMGQSGKVWPHWMNTSQHAGKFPNNLDAGSEMVLLTLEAVSRHTAGHVPPYFEVINEPDQMLGFVSWETFINYYRIVADKLKKRFPKMKVGGPTHDSIGVPIADRDDFLIWKRMKQFLDMSLDHMDFYGFHSYNHVSSGSFVGHEWRSMAEARLVNVIDLIESYSYHKKGHGVPIIISEYGLGGPNMQTPTASNFQMWGHCFMRHTHLFTFLNFRGFIDRAIPFLLNSFSKYESISIYRHSQYTEIAKTYEFWSYFNYNFEFLRVDSQFNGAERHISALAVANPHTKEVVILLHNVHNSEFRVKMNFANHWMNAKTAHKTCFFMGTDNVPVLNRKQLITLTGNVFHMPPKASCYLSIMSGHNFDSVPTVQESTYYASHMVIPIKGKIVNTVVSVSSLGHIRFANLRIGVSNKDKKAHTKPHALHINGHVITENYSLYQPGRGTGDTIWDVFVYHVPANALKQHSNAIRLEFSQDGGYVSTVALVIGTVGGGSTVIG